MHHARKDFQLLSDKKYLYCLGGTSGNTKQKLFERYSIENKVWEELSPLEANFDLAFSINDKHFVGCFSDTLKDCYMN